MKLCNVDINCYNKAELMRLYASPRIVVTVNAEAIVRAQTERRLHKIISENVSTIDGQIPLWLYRRTYKAESVEKLSGSDIIYEICQWAAKNNIKVFLLGGNQESNVRSVEKLKQMYGRLQIEGFSPAYQPYPFSLEHNKDILNHIGKAAPEILFVGFGMGKQEYWADEHLGLLKIMGVKLVIGCGGTFDFVSGRIKRAPKTIQNMGLEGLWRLFSEFKWFRIKRIFLSFKIFPLYFKYHILQR